MPEIAYMDTFLVKHPAKKMLARICATLVLIGVFAVLWIFVKHKETRYIFALFVILGTFLLLLLTILYSFRCVVNEEHLYRTYWGMFGKECKWSDVICVRTVEQKKEKAVIIALYNRTGKCVMDFTTDMQNAWYLVKMAEHKGIEIREEADLTLRQLRRLSFD